MGADAASSKPSRPNDSEIVVTSLVSAAGTRHARGLIKAMRLALLPTGEAVRPEEVRRIRIEPEPMVLEQEVRRYAVVIELADQPPWTLRSGLAFDDAVSLSRRCGQAVNEGLAPKE
jgi:hypothetical protein